ncbi:MULTISPECIES: hypothetical protein [unclassified Duganella]|uniref:hypothetical protein n=1 Tax=unclassified Duganella TaxID=2636909 RepID=UPI0006F99B38|nr:MULTISPECIES: hypothetical protein [unclassified Duganella]KQV42948.1 hypothetical protein ASD07_21105 [Duganella sp. Root336D2]KRB97074.1 hypothetical protein ASE26_03290 [Duganella sp. Root198D2]
MLYHRFAFAIALVIGCSTASAGSLAKAYADKSNNVHVVTASGKDIKLTTDRRADDVRLAPDGESATWLVLSYFAADGRKWPTELHVYHAGRTRSSKCGLIIREYWFWKDGSHVATDCGGLHFSGIETLYELRTMKEVDSFDQAEVPVEKRPEWSTASRE